MTPWPRVNRIGDIGCRVVVGICALYVIGLFAYLFAHRI